MSAATGLAKSCLLVGSSRAIGSTGSASKRLRARQLRSLGDKFALECCRHSRAPEIDRLYPPSWGCLDRQEQQLFCYGRECAVMTRKSLHKSKQLYFSQSASKRSIIIEEHLNWRCLAGKKLIFRECLWINISRVFTCGSKCMVSVILPSPTEHNFSDSDIAGWLRLGSHGTHWQLGRAGQGGLNLKLAGAEVLQAQHRTSDISQKAPRLKLEPQFSRHISYNTPFGINAGGVVVRAALQYAWDSQFESASHACFCKMSHRRTYASFILTCTQIYRVHKRIYDLVLAHMRIYPDIQVSSMDIKSCICIYWFVLSTALYILSIALPFSHFLFNTKNPKQCYRISADIRKHILFLGVVQVVSFLRELRYKWENKRISAYVR